MICKVRSTVPGRVLVTLERGQCVILMKGVPADWD